MLTRVSDEVKINFKWDLLHTFTVTLIIAKAESKKKHKLEVVLIYEAPIRRDGHGDTDTAIRDTAISENSNTAIRRVYI